jgi:hypothetical protein
MADRESSPKRRDPGTFRVTSRVFRGEVVERRDDRVYAEAHRAPNEQAFNVVINPGSGSRGVGEVRTRATEPA